MSTMEENTRETGTRTGLEIAIVGMAGRFPGARGIDRFWHNLQNGVESISFFSDEELEKEGVNREVLDHPNYVKARGILENIEEFDAAFFDYLPEEAELMDPQMRQFHECSWEALEDAGYDPGTYTGLIGLYAGVTTNHYWASGNLLQARAGSERFMNAYLNSNFFSTLISYKLNLKGPSITVQTACSTSLAAIHQASRAILTGECHMALAGGVTVTFPQKKGYMHQQGMIHSNDGHCRAFDADSSGTVDGNGVAVVILKKLTAAEADGDRIHAVIKGSALNNDGKRKVGYTAPSVEGQTEVIRSALQMAEIDPQTITYVETHGTGTQLGDPIEIEALKQAFGNGRKNYCALGSVKTNIGHLDSAAGAASVIKTVLALKNRQIPPSLHYKKPNPKTGITDSPFYVNAALQEWRRNGTPLRAGVSSFGIGGTNVHAVLEEAPPRQTSSPCKHRQLLLFSAKSDISLEQMTENLGRRLRDNPSLNLPDVAYTLRVGRAAFKHRKMLTAVTTKEAAEAILTPEKGEVEQYAVTDENPRLIFMFPGQGAQHVNMGKQLYESEPLFREKMDWCFQILNRTMGQDIKEIIYPWMEEDGAGEAVNRTEYAQPLIFSIEYSLACVLMSRGYQPYAMMGHSIGEYVAAALAGVFAPEDALKLVATRGKLMQRMPEGAMAGVALPEQDVIPYLSPDLSVAAVNSTAQTVVSGPHRAVDEFIEKMTGDGHKTRRLITSHAFHSAMMDPILDRYREAVSQVPLNKPKIPYISNVTGQWITEEQAQDPQYWTRQLRGTVRFSQGLQRLLENETALLLEVGPGTVLNTFAGQHRDKKPAHLQVNLMKHPGEKTGDHEIFLKALGRLWLYGLDGDPAAQFAGEQRKRVSLPTYPFEKQTYRRRMILLKKMFKMLATGTAIADISERTAESIDTGETTAEGKQENGGDLRGRPRPPLPTPYIAPRNDTEHRLAVIWQQYFGLRQVGIRDSFFDLGGDSLKAMNLISYIQGEFKVPIPLQAFFSEPNIKGVAEYLDKLLDKLPDKQETQNVTGIQPAEQKEYYPLSSAQRRLYIIQQIGKENVAYNMTAVLNLEGTVCKKRLEETLEKLIRRHESLRTSFQIVKGEPVQKIHTKIHTGVPVIVEYHDLTHPSTSTSTAADEEQPNEARLVNSFVRAFDLSKAPVMRMGLIKRKEQEYVLMLDIHHTISDGISQTILVREFAALYDGETLPPLTYTYKDFSQMQNNPRQLERIKDQENYWVKKYDGEIPALNLPTDHPRPPIQLFSGGRVNAEISPEDTQALKELARKEEITLYMLLMTIYNIFLAKITGQEDIIVAGPTAGRRCREQSNIIGAFINTLTFRAQPQFQKTIKELAAEIKKETLAAFENQDYQYEDLVERLAVNRDAGRNPLFDTMLVLQNMDLQIHEFNDFKLKPYKYESGTSMFDLTLRAIEGRNRINLTFEYAAHLFEKETIQRYAAYFKRVATAVRESLHRRIREIDILSEAEKEQLIYHFGSGPEKDYPAGVPIHRFLQRQAEKTPDRVCLTAPARTGGGYHDITYTEFNRAVQYHAGRLGEKGVRPGTIVSLMMERTPEMQLAIMAIQRAGGAYLPVDPANPADRIRYILADSGARHMVTLPELAHKAREAGQGDIIEIPPETAVPDEPLPPPSHNEPSDGRTPAYVIYTSGTTGKPKGAVIDHHSQVNRLQWMQEAYPLAEHDVILHKTPYTFDVSVWELSWWAMAGARVCQLTHGTEKDPARIAAAVSRHHITHVHFVPSMLNQYLEYLEYLEANPHGQGDPHNQTTLKRVIASGEALTPTQVKRFHRQMTARYGTALANLYGPTEATIDVSYYDTQPQEKQETIPIGKPIHNTRLLILDRDGRIQPVGVPGELHIAGVGLARGYLNRPELTAERFINYNILSTDGKENPRESPAPHYSRLYKTGDLTRWQPDGNIEFIGRLDHQVKIRGLRIELGEIENTLLKHNDVHEAVVLVKNASAEGKTDQQVLTAYIAANTEFTAEEIRDYLSQTLPEYMIPSSFVRVDKMPLTANGKVNRNALQTIGTQITTGTEYAPPRNETEETIAQLWQEVLNLDKIGIHDNFFDRGGTSLDIIKLGSKFNERLNEENAVMLMFRYTTISDFARYLDRKREGAEGTEENFGTYRTVEMDKVKKKRAELKNKRKPKG